MAPWIVCGPLLSLTIATSQAAAIMRPILLVMDVPGLVIFSSKGNRTNPRIMIPVGVLLGALFFHWGDIRWQKTKHRTRSPITGDATYGKGRYNRLSENIFGCCWPA
ncbi:MAG: hypothetical protein WCK63_10130 [Betaproteobacteria bacterium]